jgi:hypothetical protein
MINPLEGLTGTKLKIATGIIAALVIGFVLAAVIL